MKPIIQHDVAMHRVVAGSAWIQGNIVSPQAFLPRPKDKSKLSLFDLGQDAQAALDAWRARFPKNGANATLTQASGNFIGLELALHEDPSQAFDAHCTADFSGLIAEDAEIAATLLAESCKVGP